MWFTSTSKSVLSTLVYASGFYKHYVVLVNITALCSLLMQLIFWLSKYIYNLKWLSFEFNSSDNKEMMFE